MVCGDWTTELMRKADEKAWGPLRNELLKSTPTHTTQSWVASQVMLESPEFRSWAKYEALKFPLASVLIWLPFTVVPSHPIEESVGRLATSPPGSAHSMIWSPLGSAERTGNPLPDTMSDCPSA